jgi:flagellar biosynthesis anti-sigma factor FlgM
MKIHGERPELNNPLAGRVEANRPSEARGGQTAAASGPAASDRVRVSDDAKLASAAIAAAEQSPDVRPEAVARGKAVLASGKLGLDHERLADAIIDRSLDSEK